MHIAVLLWSAPSIHVKHLYHGLSRENQKQKTVYLTNFTCINRTFDTGHPIHVNWLPLRVVRSRNSVYFVVRFTLSDERNWVNWQENSMGADSESLFVAQPSHIWSDYKNYTWDIIYALCAIESSCLHSLEGHYPYNSIYPHPCWDDSNYSYPSQIRGGTNVCSHSAIYRKLIAVEWTKKM